MGHHHATWGAFPNRNSEAGPRRLRIGIRPNFNEERLLWCLVHTWLVQGTHTGQGQTVVNGLAVALPQLLFAASIWQSMCCTPV